MAFRRRQYNASGANGEEPFVNGEATSRAKSFGNGAMRNTMPLSGLVRRIAQRVLHDRVRIKTRKRGNAGRLTESQVREIRRRYSAGEKVAVLAAENNFTVDSMKHVIDGTNYAWVI